MIRKISVFTLFCWIILLGGPAGAQDEPQKPGFTDLLRSVMSGAKSEALDQAELETRFADQLTSSVLVGYFRMARGDGPLSEPREERYTIEKVQKLSGDIWMFITRIQYGKRDVVIPLPIRVVWAGDTPIITVTDLAIPGIATYSARIAVYRGYYAGTWHGTGYGGTMSGKIEKIGAE